MKSLDIKKIQIRDLEGNIYQIPKEGSLGLLALGYVGLEKWRETKKESISQNEES